MVRMLKSGVGFLLHVLALVISLMYDSSWVKYVTATLVLDPNITLKPFIPCKRNQYLMILSNIRTLG